MERVENLNPLEFCYICKQRSKYICPRCKIDYCSVKCYKSPQHAQCSELFYKKCVLKEHGLNENAEDEKLLQNYYKIFEKDLFAEIGDEENFDDTEGDQPSDQEEELEQRLKDIDLEDSHQVWEKLNIDEKEQFEKALKNNEEWLSHLIPLWKPWWKIKVPKSYLIDSDDRYETLFQPPYNLPPIWTTKSINIPIEKASKSLPYNIINILLGYSYMCRLYNGVHLENSLDALQVITNVSQALSPNFNCNAIKDAVYHCLDCLIIENSAISSTKDKVSILENFSEQIITDVVDILNGPFIENAISHPRTTPSINKPTPSKFPTLYIQAALSDIRLLIMSARNEIKNDVKAGENKIHRYVEFSANDTNIRESNQPQPKHDHKSNLVLNRDSLKRYVKKVEFYICWIKWFQLSDDSYEKRNLWIAELRCESDSLKTKEKTHKNSKTLIEQNLNKIRTSNSIDIKKPLIEEL